jgi:hypothetical protein
MQGSAVGTTAARRSVWFAIGVTAIIASACGSSAAAPPAPPQATAPPTTLSSYNQAFLVVSHDLQAVRTAIFNGQNPLSAEETVQADAATFEALPQPSMSSRASEDLSDAYTSIKFMTNNPNQDISGTLAPGSSRSLFEEAEADWHDAGQILFG